MNSRFLIKLAPCVLTILPVTVLAECNPCIDVTSLTVSRPYEKHSTPTTDINFSARIDGATVLSVDIENSSLSFTDDLGTDLEESARKALTAAAEAGGWQPNMDDVVSIWASANETGFEGNLRIGAVAAQGARELRIRGSFMLMLDDGEGQTKTVTVPDVLIHDGIGIEYEGGEMVVWEAGSETIDGQDVPIYTWEDTAVRSVQIKGYEAPGGAQPGNGEFYGISGQPVTLVLRVQESTSKQVPVDLVIGVGL